MYTGKRRESRTEKWEISNHLNIPQIFDFEYETMFSIEISQVSTGPPLECATFRDCVETSSGTRPMANPGIPLSA
jgi:hypothetical protein